MLNRFQRQRGVYIVRGCLAGLIKVGYSRNLKQRIQCLRSQIPEQIEVLGFVLGVSEDAEKELHARFKFWHVRHEWFRSDTPIIEYIKTTPLFSTHLF